MNTKSGIKERFRQTKDPAAFCRLLWEARGELSAEELRQEWIRRLRDCGPKDRRPYDDLWDDAKDYEDSRCRFYVELEKDTPELLDCYFNRPRIYKVEKCIIRAWMEEGNWAFFTKYLSLVIRANTEESFESSEIRQLLDQYMAAWFYAEGEDDYDEYGRGCRDLMAECGDEFAEALVQISQMCEGCACHESYHTIVKRFLMKAYGDTGLMRKYGLEDSVDTRPAHVRLKEYVHEFLQGGELIHDSGDSRYRRIREDLEEELYGRRIGQEFTISLGIDPHVDDHGHIQKVIATVPEGRPDRSKNAGTADQKEKQQTEIPGTADQNEKQQTEIPGTANQKAQQQTPPAKAEISGPDDLRYFLAKDDEIAEFYFQHSPQDYLTRRDLIVICIKKHDFRRAEELVDLMAAMKTVPGYGDLNGWGQANAVTMQDLIASFDVSVKDFVSNRWITDDMRQEACRLIRRMMPDLPPASQEKLKSELYRIDPSYDDTEEYIRKLLDDADYYTALPHPRRNGRAASINQTIRINQISEEIFQSFRKLSHFRRLDVIAVLMKKFAAVKEILEPVSYTTWMWCMADDLSAEDLLEMYRKEPELFDAWLEMTDLRDREIFDMAFKLCEVCTRPEFQSFREKVIAHRGYTTGLDMAFRATSENTETRTIFDGQTARIDLDFLEIANADTVPEIWLHLHTEVKDERLETVRASACRVNGIATDQLGGEYDLDEEPRAGFDVFPGGNDNLLMVYSDVFEENDIAEPELLELEFFLADRNAQPIERTTPLVVRHDVETGEYRIEKIAESREVPERRLRKPEF